MEANRAKYNIWTARAVPVALAGVVGYATYVLVALLCGMIPSIAMEMYGTNRSLKSIIS